MCDNFKCQNLDTFESGTVSFDFCIDCYCSCSKRAVTMVSVTSASITKTLLHFVQIAFLTLPICPDRVLLNVKIYKSEDF